MCGRVDIIKMPTPYSIGPGDYVIFNSKRELLREAF